MSSSVKRFELFRMLFAIAIALLVSFGIIFLVSSQPLTAIYTLITGPFKSDDPADLYGNRRLHHVFCQPDQSGR